MVYVQGHQSTSGPTIQRTKRKKEKKRKRERKPANNDTVLSFLDTSALAGKEFSHVLTGLEHSEMMDLVLSNIAYNRSVRCPI